MYEYELSVSCGSYMYNINIARTYGRTRLKVIKTMVARTSPNKMDGLHPHRKQLTRRISASPQPQPVPKNMLAQELYY